VDGGATKRLDRLLLAASAAYLVSLFFPWERARFPGTVYGWDSLLGVVCGVAAFVLLVVAHASSLGRLGPLVVLHSAVALAFFTATRLVDEDVVRPLGYSPAWGAYVGIGAATVALATSLVILAGGWQQFVDRLPGLLRADRL